MGDKTLMPMARQDRPKADLQWDLSPRALERWTPNLMAAAPDENHTISILDPIGVDPWTGEGVTAKRIAGALRSIGADSDVVVNINSPGGDLFEAFAIYNMLREHKGQVTVKVLGMAASSASVIAMAGDEIQIAKAGFMMVHDVWTIVMGNANDLRDVADQMDPFDAAMADIYAAHTGQTAKYIKKMMDAETWINGSAAVEQGFADSLLPADEVKQDKNARADRVAAYRLDAALAKAGLPRNERRTLLHDYKAGIAGDEIHPPRAVAGAPTPKEHDMTDDVKTPAAPQPATAEQLKAEFDRGVAEGNKTARTTERDRIAAITGHAEAEGRTKLAAHLAKKTETSVEDAVAMLAAAPKEAAAAPPKPGNLLAAAMEKIPNANVGAGEGEDGEESEEDVGKRMAAMVNKHKPKLTAVR